jgi:hypothetical protein
VKLDNIKEEGTQDMENIRKKKKETQKHKHKTKWKPNPAE